MDVVSQADAEADVERDLILRNIEGLCEYLSDQLDILVAASTAAPVKSGGFLSGVSEGVVTCPVCLQMNKPEQVKAGRCFVCGTPLSSFSG